MIYTLKSENTVAKISSRGAELISLEVEGRELMWQGESWSSHAPILFPVCGKLKGSKYSYGNVEYSLPGHGFAGKREFFLIKSTDSSVELMLTSDKETLDIYPFYFCLKATYTLEGSSLKASFRIENMSSVQMPYMFGWHPGFNLPGEMPLSSYSVKFENANNVEIHPLRPGTPFISEEILPYPLKDGCYDLCEEEIYREDTLILTGTGTKSEIICRESDFSLTLEYSENLPYFCIWKYPDSESRFICLEPWTDTPANGLDDEVFESRKMQRLESGKSELYEYKILF